MLRIPSSPLASFLSDHGKVMGTVFNGKIEESVETRGATQTTKDDGVTAAEAIRMACRRGQWTRQTSGSAPGFVQGNIVILPKENAQWFLDFCKRNPRNVQYRLMPAINLLKEGIVANASSSQWHLLVIPLCSLPGR